MSRYLLLNHWEEFIQICYITSSHGKSVWEQHYFLCVFIHPCVFHLYICPSRYLLQNHWVKFNQTCYMYITSPHGKGVQEQCYFHVCIQHLSICPSHYHLLNHWGNLTKLATWPPLKISVSRESLSLSGDFRWWNIDWAFSFDIPWQGASADAHNAYHIQPNCCIYPYKCTVKQFRSLQITASVFSRYLFIKANVVGTHMNCIDLSMQFKWVPTTCAFIKKIRKNRISIIR